MSPAAPALPIDDGPARAARGPARARARPCCRRRPARARPRACRWRCWTRGWSRAASSCWSRAASPPAPRPSAWPRPWARPVGDTVGYRIRGEAKVGRATRIEVVTEGILTRMIQSDPALDGIGALIFDEFHERSLNADLGLALALEVRAALRDDLLLLVMSATLDAEPVAALMGDAPVITSAGPRLSGGNALAAPPAGRPRGSRRAMADLILQAAAEDAGGRRAGLPARRRRDPPGGGAAEGSPAPRLLRRARCSARWISPRSAPRPRRSPQGRRIVLATSIAETSLTLPDIRVVVDGGRARRARFDPGQRHVAARDRARHAGRGRAAPGPRGPGGRGRVLPALVAGAKRAGLPPIPRPRSRRRTSPGWRWNWRSGAATRGLPSSPRPIPACWPRRGRCWRPSGALDGRADHRSRARAGRAAAASAARPHAAAGGARAAAPLAALLAERDPVRGAPPDLALRLAALRDPARFAARPSLSRSHRPTVERIRDEARRLARAVPDRRVRPFARPRWPHSPIPTGSGCAARAMRRAGCFRAARARRWSRACRSRARA